MNSRHRNVSEDPKAICRRSSRLSADELIPIDLIIEIFSRLPLKSVATCRCVSKRWASLLTRPDLTELFLTKSLAHPQLLFACNTQSELNFFSSPQPQNPDENMSTIATDHHMSFPLGIVYEISSPVNGFVCISQGRMLIGRKTPELVWVICNPSTRQYFPLPKVKTIVKTRKRSRKIRFLGYDPIEKQHKVLAMIFHQDGAVEHHVLTLRGNEKLTWRSIGIEHCLCGPNSICISGVLYYAARASNGDAMIVCFDVRSEKYNTVKGVVSSVVCSILVNYNGKLASLVSARSEFYAKTVINTSFEMWILEDPEKHEWSKRVLELPPMWKDVAAGKNLAVTGLTATNEIVFSSGFSSDIFHVYYYNFDKETITGFEIQGMGALERGSRIFTFLNHVEDVNLW